MKGQKILIIRLSAMGDVAMTAPVLKQLAQQNPKSSFVFLTRPLFKAFLEDLPNVTVFPFDPNTYKGIAGLYRLYKELKKQKIDAVADLHYNLRSRILSLFFWLSAIPIAHLNKGRKEKKALSRKENKTRLPLEPTWKRYTEVFKNLGLEASIENKLIRQKEDLSPEILSITQGKNAPWIGISPFAQHMQKVYPLDKMEDVIRQLSKYKIFIFGGGTEEKQTAEVWEREYEHVTSTIGKIKLQEELKLISNLDVMISMDSSGMHMASLKGVRVVSVWGATHPYAGFLGFGQQESDCAQIDLECRPCSIYGNKPCFRGDLACLNWLAPEIIVTKTKNILQNV
ncbi:glycosyl transferase family 9 [Pseudopedobacter saltans DSM 12145]|uniref:Glycosyl transferase family 9 n=1 Tax=Pseudopedobacter saltans (strain ATCC 51119 / DSM 12145 / JCM 21818 / CCUG 39354 / LMG 10337 / NBRC 100064 / NCIMB 13643) TaxID=762903 RepID=F0SB24_PSESL|nr:glycosyltransferase family 9 protein [Pseudopedobacter saltans]ADY52659.1 glycosyl transferase family 9 [Pseudopedobacter saltans DSM 12145]